MLFVNARFKYSNTALQTLDTIHSSFPRVMVTYLRDFLSSSLHHLQVLFPTFTHFYLSSSASPPSSSEDDQLGLPHLVCPLIDFVSTVTRGGKAKEWFDSGNLQALIGAVFNYVQMTEDDVSNLIIRIARIGLNQSQGDTWATNANAFVAQEDDETQSYSVRIAGFDLLGVSPTDFSGSYIL